MKNRSVYTFQLNCNSELANNLIQEFLKINNFVLIKKKGEQFYRGGDLWLEGYRYFNYSIDGQNITIYAWLKGITGDIPVEQNSINVVAMNYRILLGNLFKEIDRISNGGNNNMNNNEMKYDPNTGQPLNQNVNNNEMKFDPNTGQPLNQNVNNSQMKYDPNTGQPLNQNVNINGNNQSANQFSQNFQNQTIHKQEVMCEWGFWLSLLGIFAAFMGVSYSFFVYILCIYFASQGLKTSKRKKAIATFIMTGLSLVIIIMVLSSM